MVLVKRLAARACDKKGHGFEYRRGTLFLTTSTSTKNWNIDGPGILTPPLVMKRFKSYFPSRFVIVCFLNDQASDRFMNTLQRHRIIENTLMRRIDVLVWPNRN